MHAYLLTVDEGQGLAVGQLVLSNLECGKTFVQINHHRMVNRHCP